MWLFTVPLLVTTVFHETVNGQTAGTPQRADGWLATLWDSIGGRFPDPPSPLALDIRSLVRATRGTAFQVDSARIVQSFSARMRLLTSEERAGCETILEVRCPNPDSSLHIRVDSLVVQSPGAHRVFVAARAVERSRPGFVQLCGRLQVWEIKRQGDKWLISAGADDIMEIC